MKVRKKAMEKKAEESSDTGGAWSCLSTLLEIKLGFHFKGQQFQRISSSPVSRQFLSKPALYFILFYFTPEKSTFLSGATHTLTGSYPGNLRLRHFPWDYLCSEVELEFKQMELKQTFTRRCLPNRCRAARLTVPLNGADYLSKEPAQVRDFLLATRR